MKSRRLRMFLHLPLAVLAAAAASAARADGVSISPSFGLRVRQAILPHVYSFDPAENDRNWIRCRARAGVRLEAAPEH
ncbi:MAG: hypothetical protein ABIH26_04585, partial [Candidatus Eisenbacteria bacterium]